MDKVLVDVSALVDVVDALKYRLTREDDAPIGEERLSNALNAMIDSIEPWMSDEDQPSEQDLELLVQEPDMVTDERLMHLDYEVVMFLYLINHTRRTHPVLKHFGDTRWSVEVKDPYGDILFTFF